MKKQEGLRTIQPVYAKAHITKLAALASSGRDPHQPDAGAACCRTGDQRCQVALSPDVRMHTPSCPKVRGSDPCTAPTQCQLTRTGATYRCSLS